MENASSVELHQENWVCRITACTNGWLLRAGSNVTYSFSTWEREDMGVRRVGGQATMLPNGDTMLTGGSQGAAQKAVLLVWLGST
jgi:hypothetical protein